MRKRVLFCVILFLLLTCVSAISADVKMDVKKVAVLPLSVHSAENIDYVQKGVWTCSIPASGVSGKIDVLGRHSVVEALGSPAKRYDPGRGPLIRGKKLNVDLCCLGSITKIGNSVSLDGKLLETASSKAPVGVFAQSQGLDDVITKVNDFARGGHPHPGAGPLNFRTAAPGQRQARPRPCLQQHPICPRGDPGKAGRTLMHPTS